MAFNLFGPPTKDDIRVGYIDPDRGYVDGFTVCQANEYAIKNPGTTFIFRNGNNVIQYLNINEVNSLDPNVLVSTDECGGINQRKECGPPTIQMFGGGGIGAAGNPIIGKDGSILAVDVVRGGNGYQYPPIVAARDNCNYGTGATLTAVLGEVTETIETYENESDFEDYELCEPTDVGYGRRYGPDGEDLGPWEPQSYTEPGEDPIRKEVEEYEKIVRRLARAPFWTTRSAKPTKITCSDSRVIPSKYDVTDAPFIERQKKDGVKNPVGWNEFMNTYAISPMPPSNVRGSDFAGRLFTFEWTEDFPLDGEYIFRGLCDNKAQLYVDNLKVADLGSFADGVKPIKKTITKGLHNVRVDLLNVPILKTVTTQLQQTQFIDVDFTVYGQGAFRDLSFIFTSEDGKDSFTIEGARKTKETRVEKRKIRPNVTYKVVAKEDSKKYKTVEQGLIEKGKKNKEGGLGSSNKIFADYVKSGNDNDDIQITAGSGIFKSSNKRRTKEGRNTYDLTFKVDSGSQISSQSSSTNSSSFRTQKVFNTVDYIDKANRTLWRTNVFGRGGWLNEAGVCPFDTTVQLKDNPYAGVHTIVWSNVNFPVDGNYRIRLAVDDNVTLKIGDQVTITKRGYLPRTEISTGEFNESRFIKAGNYSIVADLEQIPGGQFGFTEGLKGVNPMALAIDIETTTVTETVISPRSWIENPMGVSMTIDAPEPTVPKEPVPIQEGRCPPNPIWTTRFPGAKETWYPVKFDKPNTWSKFMNRYAISPVKPLDTPGSDISGSTFTNSWDIDIPYDGFYGVRGTRDNTGRILIDGTEVSKLDGFSVENPDVKKVFITKGKHTIGVEVFNQPVISETVVNQKIFRTKDWQVAGSPSQGFIDVDFTVYGQGAFRDLSFIFTSEDGKDTFTIEGARKTKETRIEKRKIRPNVNYKVVAKEDSKKYKTVEQGLIEKGKKNKEGGNDSTSNKIFADYVKSGNDNDDIQITTSSGIFTSSNKRRTKEGRNTYDLTFRVGNQEATKTSGQLKSGTIKDGVTYEGPPLFAYKDNRWGEFMNNHSVSPLLPPLNAANPEINGVKRYVWRKVNFPESGQYDIAFQADNDASLIINGVKVLSSQGYEGPAQFFKVNITQGRYDILVECNNIPDRTNIFNNNPTGFGIVIRKNVTLRNTNTTPWSSNPVGISAILIPPPCPKRIRGRGVVTDVIVNDPGNGYLPPAPQLPGYPVALRLKKVIVENPGINYNCGVDELRIAPSNGAELEYICDPFGKIREVKVLNPGLGFTEYPEIRLISETGVNASFRPVFEVVRDPIVLPERLIQVTDLVGLKQTGYVNGRPYYGAVYYDQGVRYAGFYETIGEPVRVYDTLQESITGEVTTAPSAIQRQGTDITSNDPRLNIPGTPENLI